MKSREQSYTDALDRLGLSEHTTTVSEILRSLDALKSFDMDTACAYAGVSPKSMSGLIRKHPPGPFEKSVRRNESSTCSRAAFDKWWNKAGPKEPKQTTVKDAWKEVMDGLLERRTKAMVTSYKNDQGQQVVLNLGNVVQRRVLDEINRLLKGKNIDLVFGFMPLRDALSLPWHDTALRQVWSDFYREEQERVRTALDADLAVLQQEDLDAVVPPAESEAPGQGRPNERI